MQNTLLTISFNRGEIHFWHSTCMGNLGEVFDLGNVYRNSAGLPSVPLAAWIQRQDVTEYAAFLSASLNRPAIERRKGKAGGTWAHLKILIDAATSLSPEFKDEVLEAFLLQKIHIARDESGELFKDMNSALVLYADKILGKPAHKGHFVTIANAIRCKVGAVSWDTASGHQLQKRCQIEGNLTNMLRLGLVRDWEHLKEIIERI